MAHKIYNINQIILPNGTKLMSPEEFKIYYQNPTKLDKSALNIAEQLFCEPKCDEDCPNPCQIHLPPRTLKNKYKIYNHRIIPRTPTNPVQVPQPPQQPAPPQNIKNDPIKFPIRTILNHKTITTKDKYKIPKKYNTYLCQWIDSNHITYNKWLQQRELFPLNLPTVIHHNINLLTKYYTDFKNKHYQNIINTQFTPEQNRDTRHIPSPTIIPYIKTSTIECNPERDIDTNKCTIQTQNDKTHIYNDIGKYITTIPTTRIKWLWQQYNNNKYNNHRLIPAIQPFETEVVWLYQRYEHKNHKKNTIKTPHHTIPSNILDTLITTFNITHSYFSSPITCSMKSTQFYSTFARDKIFGSLGTAFQYKWKGIGYAHPNDAKTAQQAIH